MMPSQKGRPIARVETGSAESLRGVSCRLPRQAHLG